MKKLLLLAIAILFYAIAILAKPSKKEHQSKEHSGLSSSPYKSFE